MRTAVLALLLFLAASVEADTSFTIWGEVGSIGSITAMSTDNDLEFGYAYWNDAGQRKSSFALSKNTKPHSWTAKYDSLTVSQIGLAFPHEGVNEKGLIVHMLNVDTSLPAPRDDRESMNEFEFVQWLLDRFASVKEISEEIEPNQNLPIAVRQDFRKVHFRIADAQQQTMILEWRDGSLRKYVFEEKVNRGLANESWQDCEPWLDKRGRREIRNSSSLARLDRVLKQSETAKASSENVKSILNSVVINSGELKTRLQTIYMPDKTVTVSIPSTKREIKLTLHDSQKCSPSRTTDLAKDGNPRAVSQKQEETRMNQFFKKRGLTEFLSAEKLAKQLFDSRHCQNR